MLRLLYTLLFYLALPFAFLRLLYKSRKLPAYRKHFSERLGFAPFTLKRCIWLHVVSVGETIAATPLIHALLNAYPDVPLVLTNMTATGKARVQTAFGDQVRNCYIPYDTPFEIKRFIRRVNPMVCLLMETELWPNLLHECKQRSLPTLLINARMSEKSVLGYLRFKSASLAMMQALTKIAAQAQTDAERFMRMGAKQDQVVIAGNIKFDLELPKNLDEKTNEIKVWSKERPVWIAASTHEGEEEILLKAHRKVIDKIPNTLLILVPRHPERFEAIKKLSEQHTFNVVTRSSKENCADDVQVFLGDTMGEMMYFYTCSDIAFVGGSLIVRGGHNILEPAALKLPILTGPSVFNFSKVSALLLEAGGAKTVLDEKQVAQSVIELIENKALRKQMGKNAYAIVEQNKGALLNMMQLIDQTIKERT